MYFFHFLSEWNIDEGFSLSIPFYLCNNSHLLEKITFCHFLSECNFKRDSSFPSLLFLCHTSLFDEKYEFCHFLSEWQGFSLPFPSSSLSRQSFFMKNKYFVIFCRNSILIKFSASIPLLLLGHTSLFYEKKSILSFSVRMQYKPIGFVNFTISKKGSIFPSSL